MTRVLNALKADMLFQFKQGFYFIYIIITILYLIILSQLDPKILKYVLPVLLYIDPSILGLFFIGGILLLEQEQGILSLVYVTPLKTTEFMASKLISLCLISLLATLTLSLVSYQGNMNMFLLIIGVLLTSLIYTLFGFTIATKSKSVNDFFVKMIPMMIVFIIPAILMFVFPDNFWLNFFPSVSTLRIIWGAYHDLNFIEGVFCITYSTIVTCIFYYYAYKVFHHKMIVTD